MGSRDAAGGRAWDATAGGSDAVSVVALAAPVPAVPTHPVPAALTLYSWGDSCARRSRSRGTLLEVEAFRVFGTIPFVAGIILGSVLVSRELESRTAQLGWSLSGARRRWLVERIVPVVVPLMVVLSAPAIEAVHRVLRGDRLSEIEQREALILGAGTVLALGASLVVVGRRRPY